MGIRLKVTPEVLIKTVSDIETQISDIEAQFGGIGEDISRTRSYWEGEASDMHKSQYDSMKEDVSEAIKNLKSNPKNLLQMAGLYTETEQQVEEVAQSLQADVIV